MRILILTLALCLPASAQFPILPGVLSPNTPVAAGTALLGNFGGMGTCGELCVNGPDSGNAGVAFFTPFVAPANASTWGTFNLWVGTPQATAWWLALYSDTTVSCTGGAPHCPANLICYHAASSAPASGWNSIASASMTNSCGTPTPGAFYHLGQLTNDNTQNQGTTGASGFCPGTGGLATGVALGVATTPPASAPSLGFATEVPAIGNPSVNNGCYNAYATVNYTSTAAFNVTAHAPGSCDAATQCIISTAPGQTGQTRIIAYVGSIGASAPSSVKDCTGVAACSVSTDTFTQMGSCPGVSGGFNVCFWYTNRVTAGVNNVTVNFTSSGSAKNLVDVIDLQGTNASASGDKSAYDTAYLTSSPWTSANCTGTLTQANEFLVGVAVNSFLYATMYPAVSFAATGGWTLAYQGFGASQQPSMWSVYTQSVTSTSSVCLTGTYSDPSHMDVATGIATFKQ